MALDILVLFSSQYSLLLLFFVAILGSYIVIPVFGWIIATAGASITNPSQLVGSMVVLYLAVIIGDISVYFLTRRFSDEVMGFLRKFKWFRHGEEKTYPLFRKYGLFLIFISRFLNTELCVFINYISGFEKYSSRKFITAVLIGEFIYITGYMTLGYVFREAWVSVSNMIQGYIAKILLVIVAAYILYRGLKLFIKWTKKN